MGSQRTRYGQQQARLAAQKAEAAANAGTDTSITEIPSSAVTVGSTGTQASKAKHAELENAKVKPLTKRGVAPAVTAPIPKRRLAAIKAANVVDLVRDRVLTAILPSYNFNSYLILIPMVLTIMKKMRDLQRHPGQMRLSHSSLHESIRKRVRRMTFTLRRLRGHSQR